MRYTREVSSTGTVTEYWWDDGSAPARTKVTDRDGKLLWEFGNALNTTGSESLLISTPEQDNRISI